MANIKKDLCDFCAHNIGSDIMDCELYCYGVTDFDPKTECVRDCEDYESKNLTKKQGRLVDDLAAALAELKKEG